MIHRVRKIKQVKEFVLLICVTHTPVHTHTVLGYAGVHIIVHGVHYALHQASKLSRNKVATSDFQIHVTLLGAMD